MNIQSISMMAMAFLFAMASIAHSQGNNDGSKVVAVSPVLKIKPGPGDDRQSSKAPENNKPPVNKNPPVNTVSNEPVVLEVWQSNGGGNWIGGDKAGSSDAFYNSTNWGAPSNKSAEDKGYNLNFSGMSSQAKVNKPLGLLHSSSLSISDGASLDFKDNIIAYSGKAVLVIDASMVTGVGGMKPEEKDSTLEMVITNHAMVSGDNLSGKSCDFSGGSIFIKNSTCKLSTMVGANVTIDGYGSVEVSSGIKDVIKDSMINLASPQAQFRFLGKPVEKVINEDLDKFSISGALPVYGTNPTTLEDGDNVLIRNDGGGGSTLTVVK